MKTNKLIVTAVVAALLAGCGTDVAAKYDTLVTMDVNPSIQLQLDRELRVVEALAMNADAQVLLEDMDLTNADVNVAVNAVLGSMVKEGYLSELDNAVLLSVENDDEEKRIEIERNLSEMIHGALLDYSIEGAVLSQEYKSDNAVTDLINKYDISYGKAALIYEILKEDDLKQYNVEDLVKLDAQELILIYKQIEKDTDVEIKGEVNTSKYIGGDEALNIALKDAKLSKNQIKDLEIDYDSKNGVFGYEVEFESDNKEYEYHINAEDGTFVKEVDTDNDLNNKDNNDDDDKVTAVKPSTAVKYTKDQALALALKDAGLTKSQITDLEIETDNDDGQTIYEIDFDYKNKEYSYDVNATKGIVDKDIDVDDDYYDDKDDDKVTAVKPSTAVKYTKDQALALALKDARLTKSQITDLEIETDNDDGQTIYEIDFDYKNKEYSYDVSATKGIVDKDIDVDDDYYDDKDDDDKVTAVKPSTAVKYTKDQALALALKDAGLTKSQITDLEIETDNDDGQTIYEIDFDYKNKEYSYDVSATKGIVEKEVETDD